jgi:hypothetical protein
MWRRGGILLSDVSEERIASIFRVEAIHRRWTSVNRLSLQLSVHAGSSLVDFFLLLVGVGLSPLGTAATSGLLYKPQMIDKGDCGIKIGRGNRSTRRKPAPAPLARGLLLLLRWRRYVPPKRRLKYLHGATSQKTVFFIVIAVKT